MIDWQTKDPHKGENLQRASKPGKGACNKLGEPSDPNAKQVIQKCGLIGFRGLRQFNKDGGRKICGLKRRMSLTQGYDRSTSPWFDGDSLTDRLARALAKREAIDMKEFVESFEFFSHARHKRYGINKGVVVDLACGHGLSGLLFAVFERSVERVILVDRGKPDCFEKIFEAVLEVAPWVKEKAVLRFDVDIMLLAADPDYLASVLDSRNEGTVADGNSKVGLLGVHACGHITDLCMDIAIQVGASIALMPCCYRPPRHDLGLHDALVHPDSIKRGRSSKRALPLAGGGGIFGGGGGDEDYKVLMSANDFQSGHSDAFSFTTGGTGKSGGTGNRRKNKAIRKNKPSADSSGSTAAGGGGDSAQGNSSRGQGPLRRRTSVFHPLVPESIEEHLGRGLSIDVFRTYRMQAAGYQVAWAAIPWEVTHKNRFIVAWGCVRLTVQSVTAECQAPEGTDAANSEAAESATTATAANTVTAAAAAPMQTVGLGIGIGIAIGIALGIALARRTSI
jgi:hypothetical protein